MVYVDAVWLSALDGEIRVLAGYQHYEEGAGDTPNPNSIGKLDRFHEAVPAVGREQATQLAGGLRASHLRRKVPYYC